MNFSCFLGYFRSLVAFAPARFALGCILTCLSILLSGVGLLLLVPLLHYAGWLDQLTQGSDHVFNQFLAILPPIEGQMPLLLTLAIFIVLIFCIGALQYWQARVMSHLRQDYLYDLREKFNRAIANAQWIFLLETKLKHLEHLLTLGVNQINSLTYYTVQLISGTFIIILYFGFSLLIAFKLTLLTAVISLFMFTLIRKQKAAELGKESYLLQRNMQEKLGQFLEGVKLAKSYNQTQAYAEHFSVLNRGIASCQNLFSSNSSLIRFLFLISSAFIFSIIFFVSVHLFKIQILSLIALLLIFSRLLPQISSWQQAYLQTLNIVPVYSEIQKTLNELLQNQEKLALGNFTLELKQGLFLDQVCYRYQEKQKWVINHITCWIQANTTTAIVGISGVGKSTLADLLLGLLEPIQGHIYLDREPLNGNNLYAWRNSISYVPQDPYFFNESIRANLRWVAPKACDEELWKVLKETASYDFVKALPEQLDSIIGDRGIQLSGGERQRLALARALLRKPKALLLDEATSALDSKNEELIYQSLKHLHGTMTIIIISHRYTTIRSADQVLVLEEGQLVEAGSPKDLLNKSDSVFANLFKN